MDRTTPNARPLRSPTFGSSVHLHVHRSPRSFTGLSDNLYIDIPFGILPWLQGNEVPVIRYLRCRYKSTFEANQTHPEFQLAQVVKYIGGIAGELCVIVLF